jgi:hypothetical protein
MFVTTIVADTT